jgi:hypothetical protein
LTFIFELLSLPIHKLLAKSDIMKKLILLLTIILVSAGYSFGQFALGVRIGYNASKITTNIDSIKSDFNSGFHVGVWSHFGKRLYFAPEVLYTLSGGVFTSEGNVAASQWKEKVTVGSLDVPLLLGFKIIHSKVITWRIEAGPEASFVINSKVKDMSSVTGNAPITTSNINTANWYVIGGTGINVLFLAFDIRYQYGLNDMIKDVQNQTYDSKSSLLVVSLGFKIFGAK